MGNSKEGPAILNTSLMVEALNASSSGIIITDNRQPDNPIIYCNEAFERMTGYHRNDIIGHNCRFLQKNDRDQSARTELKRAIASGQNVRVDIRNYRKDGTLFWNELYVSPIKQGNEITHFIGIQNDITRRKKAEEELKAERDSFEKRVVERTAHLHLVQEYMDSIIQTVRESLVVLDPSLKVLSVNDHFLRTFKVSKTETEGRKLYDLGDGQWNIPTLRELLEQVLPTNNPVLDYEVEQQFPHIGKKIMILNAYRVELEGAYKNRILLAIEDVSEKKEIEKRKDDFLSIASHELKTPLTTIKGFIQMMQRLMPENASQKYVEAVKKTEVHIERLNNLIKELLDVSRIQSGYMEVHKEKFDFDDMVRECADGFRESTRSHKIVVNGQSDTECYGDESQIIQVVNNLISNAIKYSPDHDEIEIHLGKVSDFIKFSVTDKGLGISAEHQAKIYERFYRVREIQENFPGMGVGLYICKQIVQAHGGSLWVESTKGVGSTFNFTLPLSSAE